MGDLSGAATDLTLWNLKALEWNSPVGTVVYVKGARVHDYNGNFFIYNFLCLVRHYYLFEHSIKIISRKNTDSYWKFLDYHQPTRS